MFYGPTRLSVLRPKIPVLFSGSASVLNVMCVAYASLSRANRESTDRIHIDTFSGKAELIEFILIL